VGLINEKKPLSAVSILLLHLLPGIPILLIALLCAHPVWGFGLDFSASLYTGIALGLIPVQLGIICCYAKKEKIKFKEAIGFKAKTGFIKTVLWVVPLLAFAVAVMVIVPDMEKPLWYMFGWVPDWFRLSEATGPADQSLTAELVSLAGLLFSCILGPLTEELYFRGFLLPRMQNWGRWAPLANAVLFSLYHFFSHGRISPVFCC
jgi:CAAX amino terminal protease family.